MIKSEKVLIKIGTSNLKRIRELGYNCSIGDEISICIKHLSLGSKSKIKVECSVCKEIKDTSYLNYNKITNKNTEDYFCSKCSILKKNKNNLSKYGVENVFQSDTVKNKIKETNLSKYGVENVFQSDTVKNKIKETNLSKYGVESYTKTEDFIKSIKSTKLKRYGFENYNNINKIKKTNLERYGVESYMKTKVFKEISKDYYLLNKDDIISKYKKSILNKYGVENIFQSELIKNKIKETNLERYGVEIVLKSEIVKNKIKETMLERYNVDNPSKLLFFQNKKKNTNNLNFIKKYLDIKIIDISDKTLSVYCDICLDTYQIDKSLFHNRIIRNSTLCTKCNNIGQSYISNREIELLNFIKQNYNDEIISCDRSILNGRELDIYLPKLKIAFEFNGLYWHSEIYKEKDYHLRKTKDCLERGIQLIHIWEDDWLYKREINESIILNKLGKSNRIYARRCQIKEVNDNKLVREFLESNHIQGFVGSKVKLGLYFKDELVSLMTFGNLRKSLGYKSKGSSYELLRFCNKLGHSIIGGSSRLFKYFIDKNQPKEIISYSDNSKGIGNMYLKLGFNLESDTIPNYYWVVDEKRKHRFNYRKDKLVREGADENLTEVQIMNEGGYYRIFDCGSKKWIFRV
jgi:hypothetical protein